MNIGFRRRSIREWRLHVRSGTNLGIYKLMKNEYRLNGFQRLKSETPTHEIKLEIQHILRYVGLL